MDKENENYYRALPRKDLQALCAAYNLPANTATCDLAESLINYSKKLNSSTEPVGGTPQEPWMTPIMKPVGGTPQQPRMMPVLKPVGGTPQLPRMMPVLKPVGGTPQLPRMTLNLNPGGGTQREPRMMPILNPAGGTLHQPRMTPNLNPFGGTQQEPRMMPNLKPVGGTPQQPRMTSNLNPGGGTPQQPRMTPNLNPVGGTQQEPRMTPNLKENAGKGKGRYGPICQRALKNNLWHTHFGSCDALCYMDHTIRHEKNKETAATHVGSNNSGIQADAGHAPSSQNRDINLGGGCAKESVGPDSVFISKKDRCPDFELQVTSAAGLDIYIDLNQSTAEWFNTEFRDKYEVCENMCHNKSHRIQQQVQQFGERSKQTKSPFRSTNSAQDKDGLEDVVCPPNLPRKEQSFMVSNKSKDGSIRPPTSFPMKPFGINADVSEHSKEDQRPVSAESGKKDESTINLDSDAIKKSDGGGSVAIMSNGSANNHILERQVSKDDNANRKESTMLNNGNPVYTDIQKASLEVEFHREREASSPSKNGNLMDVVVSKVPNMGKDCADLDNSRKVPDISGKKSSDGLEKQETAKAMNKGVDSECSEFDDQSDDSSVIRDKLEPNDRLSRKRAHMDSDDNAEYGTPDPKMLRSADKLAGKTDPRRSTRLVPKFWFLFENAVMLRRCNVKAFCILLSWSFDDPGSCIVSFRIYSTILGGTNFMVPNTVFCFLFSLLQRITVTMVIVGLGKYISLYNSYSQ
ncbi:hypothetical protein ACFE04_004105 [Oxalis oulophora]